MNHFPPTRFAWAALGLLTTLVAVGCSGNLPTEPAAEAPVQPGEAPTSRTIAPSPATEPPTVPPTGLSEEVSVPVSPVECMTPDLSVIGYVPDVPPPDILTADNRPDGLRFITAGWGTDWTRHTIPYDEILSGGPPRDGIPSIDHPQFITPEQAADWLADTEPVIALIIGTDARAYPLQILTWHEIVNDTVCGVPVAVTFCPLCNSALAFHREVEGQIVQFGTSGLLRYSDLIMYDRASETLWQQFTGAGIVGQYAGYQLTFIPASIISFADFHTAYPNGIVLSRQTGYSRAYGANPYANYDSSTHPFLFTGALDERLPAMMRIVGVWIDGEAVAYPYTVLSDRRVVNDTVNGQDIAVFYTFGTNSALGAERIAAAEDVGAAGVFDPNLDGRQLTFSWDGERIVDDQTGSVWSITGQAISGSLEGAQLVPLVHSDHFWFAWAAFYPETRIYEGE